MAESAFGIDHGDVSKGFSPMASWKAASTTEKVIIGGGSAVAGVGVGLSNKKRTGRFSGNGGLVGVAARKTGMGYAKQPRNPGGV